MNISLNILQDIKKSDMTSNRISFKYLITVQMAIWVIYHITNGYKWSLVYNGDSNYIIKYKIFEFILPSFGTSLLIIGLFYLAMKICKNYFHQFITFSISVLITLFFYFFVVNICFYIFWGINFSSFDYQYIVKAVSIHIFVAILLNSTGYLFTIWQKYKDQILKNQTLIKSIKNDNEQYEPTIFLSNRHFPNQIELKSIKYIQADAYISHIFTTTNKKITLDRSLKKWENDLPSKMFFRIHKSTIVNLKFIEKIEKLQNHTYNVFLKDCAEPLGMSRRVGKDFTSNPNYFHLYNH